MTNVSEIVNFKPVPPGWKQMSSGKGVDLARPHPSVIDFNDIATHLSLLCRFTGAMRDADTFYSVAQHSVLVSCLVPEPFRLHGLLHDAHEAYFGDDSTPKKNLLDQIAPTAAEIIRDLKRRWDLAIWEAAGIAPPSPEVKALIKKADHEAMSIERRDLLALPADAMTVRAWAWLPVPATNVFVTPMLPKTARELFIRQLGALLWPSASAGTA